MAIQYEQMSYYIDRQFGSVMYITTKDGKITGVDDDEYKGKLEADLIGLTIEQAQSFLKNTFKGVFMCIKPK